MTLGNNLVEATTAAYVTSTAVVSSSVTTLDISTTAFRPFASMGITALKQIYGKAGTILLRKLLQTGVLPQGLTREALEIYRELAIRAITGYVASGNSPTGLAEQTRRLEKEGETDNYLLHFFPIKALKPVTEELVQVGGIPDYRRIKKTLPDPEHCFVFADYMIGSHVYAIRLSSEPSAATPIIWICGSHWRVVASTFSEFGEKYFANRDELLMAPI